MLDRRLLVNALRVDNKDVLPKFGDGLRAKMESETDFINIKTLVDYDEGTLTETGIFSLMDALSRGSVGISTEDGQQAISLAVQGNEIYAHNITTDTDDIIDCTPEALKEYIFDNIEIKQEATNEAEETSQTPTLVMFKIEPNEYTGENDILAVFPDELEYVNGDEARFTCYSHVGQHGTCCEEYWQSLADATPEQYADLKAELEGQGYVLEVIEPEDANLNPPPEFDMNDIDDGYTPAQEESPLEVPVGFALDDTSEEQTVQDAPQAHNYAVIVFKDLGNDYEVVESKDGFACYRDADESDYVVDVQNKYEEDPTITIVIAYSDDNINWYDSDTDELVVEAPDDPVGESTSEASEKTPEEEVFKVGDHVKIKADVESPFHDRPLTISSIEKNGFDTWIARFKEMPNNPYRLDELELDTEAPKTPAAHESGEGTRIDASNFDEYADALKAVIANNYVDSDSIYPVFMAIKDRINTEIDYIELLYKDDAPEYFYVHTKDGKIYDVGNIETVWDWYNESGDFQSLKDCSKAISAAKKELRKRLKTNFGENFGQDKVRDLRSRIPNDSQDRAAICREVEDFANWCATVRPEPDKPNVSEDMSDVQDHLDDIKSRLDTTTAHIMDRLNYRFKDNVSYFGDEALKKLDEVYAEVETAMSDLYKEVFNIIG